MASALRKIRERAGISAIELAREMAVSTQHIYRLEANKGMSIPTAVKLSHILGKKLKVKPSKVLAELTQVDEKRTPQLETAAS